MAADLRVRGASALWTEVADFLDLERHPALVEQAQQALGGLDVALVAHGVLPVQAEALADRRRPVVIGMRWPIPPRVEVCWTPNGGDRFGNY